MLICVLGASALRQAENEYTLQELPTFKIDLDLDPELRFQEVTTHFKDQTLALVNYYLELVPEIFASLVENIFVRLEPFLLET